jgi:hypothetical protein
MMQILDKIPFALDAAALTERMCLAPGSEDARELESLIRRAEKIARPKAVYRECFLDQKGDDKTIIDGVTFSSRALRINLEAAERVFPFVVTCGREMDGAVFEKEDFLSAYWWEEIKADLLSCARQHLKEVLTERFRLGNTAHMSPGSGDSDIWPIEQQPLLFSLFGDVYAAIGVQLSESFLMTPVKSVSGIVFPTEKDFRSCQVCHRENCPSRRAPFDPALWESFRS